METRANYILIGVFTLLVIAGGFGFVWWFQRLSGSGDQVAYEVIYDGSVSGLRPGSAVLFNGIRVGEVNVIRLDTEDPRKVVALISVAATTPVRTDTKAGLELAGLTGVASVALIGGTPTAAPRSSASLPRNPASSQKSPPTQTPMAPTTSEHPVIESATPAGSAQEKRSPRKCTEKMRTITGARYSSRIAVATLV